MKDYLEVQKEIEEAIKDYSLEEKIQVLTIAYEQNKGTLEGIIFKELLDMYELQYELTRSIKDE
jgi:hypothetical protein